jgi:hypothetical protein
MNQRNRPILIAVVAILTAWLLAWSGYVICGHTKMTAEKVRKYESSMDLAHMSPADRLKAIKGLAERVNAMSPEERQRWKLDLDWFRQLTEEEKVYFLDAFLPGEMKTALKMFEQWPKQQQQHEIDQAMKELRQHAADPRGHPMAVDGTNGPLFSPELDKKIRTMGLNALYSQGSASTKAELAPLLMEVQRQFESGQLSLSRF